MELIKKIISLLLGVIMAAFPSLFPKQQAVKDYIVEGSSLVINLDADNSTTNTWSVSISDDSVIRLLKQKYVKLDKPTESGFPGRETFSFTAISDGEAVITFKYGQQWKGGKIYSTAVYKVTVDESCKVTVDSYKITKS